MRSTSSMNNFFHNDVISPYSPKKPQELVQQQHQLHQMQAHNQVRRSEGTNSPYFRQRQVEGALAYLSEVKSTFISQPYVYDEFLDIMREFKALRIDTTIIIHKVSALFRDHPRLILGFNSFLPPGYNIELPSDHSVNVASQLPPLFQHLRASSPVRKLQQNLDEKCNETVSLTSELHFNSNELHASSSERPLNSTVDVSEKMEQELISSEVQNAAQALYDNQPVEYSEAMKFVNKIKGRFHDNPGIYKQFLQILNTYQEEQKKVKKGACLKNEVLSEAEVYSKVEELFDEQTDLLAEFGKFLPSSSGNTASAVDNGNKKCSNSNGINHSASFHLQTCSKPPSKSLHPGKRLTYWSPELPKKKARAREKNISYSEAGKIGSLTEYGFFDKVRKALRTPEVYHNFLRCLVLYNKEVVSREELVELVKPFLGKFPELLKGFKIMLGFKDSGTNVALIPNKVAYQARKKVSPELEMEIDYSSCRKCGASYRALPSSYVHPKCSGRTSLCKEVLNDTWVSFPSWSEDSTFVSSRKTQYEEYIYRCEDERFELDVVLETNLSAIRALEAVMKKINRMPPEEKSKFHLDDTLGGTSTVIHQRAIRRIYGDKSADIIEGLKKNPVVAVPLVLRRLKAKEEEWREAQKNFNKQWREQNEKFYLKSLDHQGITFKQNDVKQLRSKNLLNEIETIYEEYHERAEEGIEVPIGPHMTLSYKSENILNDAANLIIHHMKRQTGIAKEDKHKIKLLLRHFISDLFEFSKGEVSDDEPEKAETEENSNSTQNKMASTKNCNASNNLSSKSCDLYKQMNSRSNSSSSITSKKSDDNIDIDSDNIDVGNDSLEIRQQFVKGSNCDLKKTHNLFYGNNNWYLFFRLHHILCERLYKIHCTSVQLAREEKKAKKDKQSAAAALQIDSKNKVSLEESYLTFISMAKSLLDGNIENTQFEDNLREMFGIHAYVAYTIDKVIQNVVRQLQAIVTDEVSSKFMELYNEFTKDQRLFDCYSTIGCAFSTECAYQKKAEELQSDENCFKIVVYIDESKLTVELLDAETDPPEDPVESSKWAEYVHGYVTEKIHAPPTRQTRKYYKGLKVFLQRNIRKWQRLAEEHTKVHAKYFSSNNQNMPATESSPSDNDSQHVPPMECVRQKAMENMEISDNTECKFNVNSYKMVFVVHSESYLYKQQGLRKTQQKTRQERLNKFHTWYKSWERRYISGLKTSKSDKDSSITSELSSS